MTAGCEHHGPDLGGRRNHRFIRVVAAESPQHLGRRPKRLHGRPDSPLLVCQRRHSGHGPICSRNAHGRNAESWRHRSALDDHRVLTLSDVEIYPFRSSNIKWTGAASGVWDVNTTANWFNTAALISDKYRTSPTADSVSFSDVYDSVYGNATTPTTTAVTLNSTVTPSSVTFDANTLNYSLSGTGGISGGTSLVKRGSGVLTISTSNSYTGGTALNGGTISISSEAALGSCNRKYNH